MSLADLTAELLAAPDDRERYLVYADALMAAGDPRGELVALQAAPGEPTPERQARIAELIERETAALFGGQPPAVAGAMHLTWRWGFVSRVALDLRAIGRVARSEVLVRNPALHLVRDLWLHGPSKSVNSVTLRWLQVAPMRHAVSRLSLGSRSVHPAPSDRHAKLLALLPRLTSLELSGSLSWDLAALHVLPRLTSLMVSSTEAVPEHFAPLAGQAWPTLGTLVVNVGTSLLPEPVLDVVRDRARCPALVALGLHAARADAVLAEVIASPHLPHLQVLGLSWGDISPAASTSARAALAHVPKLDAPTFADLPLGANDIGVVALALRTRFERPLDALALYQRNCELVPTFIDHWLSLGDAYGALERWGEQLATLEHAVRLAPSSYKTHERIGQALRQLGRRADALAAFERALAVTRWPDTQRIMIGHVRYEMGDLAGAEAVFRAMPESSVARWNLGRVLALQGRWLESLDSLAEWLREQPRYCGELYARALARVGRRDEALAALATLDAKDLPVVATRAEVLADGDPAAARAELQSIVAATRCPAWVSVAWLGEAGLARRAGEDAGAVLARLAPPGLDAPLDLGRAIAAASQTHEPTIGDQIYCGLCAVAACLALGDVARAERIGPATVALSRANTTNRLRWGALEASLAWIGQPLDELYAATLLQR